VHVGWQPGQEQCAEIGTMMVQCGLLEREVAKLTPIVLLRKCNVLMPLLAACLFKGMQVS